VKHSARRQEPPIDGRGRGIETEAQRARLAVKAPVQLQGFLLGRTEIMDRQTSALEQEPHATHTPRARLRFVNHEPLS